MKRDDAGKSWNTRWSVLFCGACDSICRMERRITTQFFIFFFLASVVIATIAFFPSHTYAISNTCTGANAICKPYVKLDGCGCGQTRGPNGCVSDPSNKQLCTCTDSTNNFTTSGVCMATCECKAGGTSDAKGVDQGLQQLMKALGDLLGKMKGGGGGGDSPPPPPTTPTTGCTGAQFQTSDISQI